MARGNFPLGNPMGGPSQPSDIMNTGQVNQVLGDFGTHLPETLRQPGLEGTSWGTMHPRVAGAIDNALIAVGGMGPTGETAGENISNVARGVMGIGPYRQQFAQEQMALPFQYAKEVGGLQGMQAEQKMRQAQAEWYGDRGPNAAQANSVKLQMAQMRDQMTGAKEPQILKDADGKKYVGVPWIDPNDPSFAVQYQRTNIDPDAFEREHARTRVASRFGSGAAGALIEGALSNKYGGPEKVPDGLSAEDIKLGVGILNQASGNVMRIADKDTQDAYKDWDSTEADIFHKSLPVLKLTTDETKTLTNQGRASYASAHPGDETGIFGAGAKLAGAQAVAAEKARRQADYDSKLRDYGAYRMSTTPEQRHQIGGWDAWKALQNPQALTPAASPEAWHPPMVSPGQTTEAPAASPQNFKGVHPNADATSPGPQPGDVEDGYRFKGGDKSDPKNWTPVK